MSRSSTIAYDRKRRKNPVRWKTQGPETDLARKMGQAPRGAILLVENEEIARISAWSDGEWHSGHRGWFYYVPGVLNSYTREGPSAETIDEAKKMVLGLEIIQQKIRHMVLEPEHLVKLYDQNGQFVDYVVIDRLTHRGTRAVVYHASEKMLFQVDSGECVTTGWLGWRIKTI